MAKLTNIEKTEIIEASLRANKAGDYAEERRLIRLLPIPPHLAMIAKEMNGKDFLLKSGYDLSAANEEFGDGWLDR